MSLIARPLADRADVAECLILALLCHACGERGLREVSQGHDGMRRTFTGRCRSCAAESVLIVELVPIHAGTREYAA